MISWLRGRQLNSRALIFPWTWLLLLLAVGLVGLLWWRINLTPNGGNLLANPDFEQGSLQGWQTQGAGGGQAALKPAADPSNNALVSLSLPDAASGSWVGIGQRVNVTPFQRYRPEVNYRLAQENSSSARVILQISQFDATGKLIKKLEFSDPDFLVNDGGGSQFDWKLLAPLFTTDIRAAVVEIGVGLLGTQATTIEVDHLALSANPSWLTSIAHDPTALMASLALIALMAVAAYRAGQSAWLNREEILFNSRKRLAQLDKVLATSLFSYKSFLIITLTFLALLVLLNVTIRFICLNIVRFDCPLYWPMSVFSPRIPGIQDLLVAGPVVLLFVLSLRYFSKINSSVFYLAGISILLVLGTNLIQGWDEGFSTPMTGGGGPYYYDAIEIENPAVFLGQFEQLQPQVLQNHSSKHPPGAVLTIYFLYRLLQNPNLISAAIGILAAAISVVFLYQILLTEFESGLAQYLTFLFILIPAIQIYFAASIDALIVGFLLGFLYFFRYPGWPVSIIGSVIFLFLASFLTFGVVFLLPVIIGYEFLRNKTVLRSGLVLLGVALVYAGIYLLFNFDYFNSFRIASYIEGLKETKGYLPLSDPAAYLPTRLEGIWEIFLFFGPVLTVLMIAGLRLGKEAGLRLLTMSRLVLLTFSALFIVGVFWTGETARVNMYIYPYLLFPVGAYLAALKISRPGREMLLITVFSQTLLMQLFGNYHW